MILAIDAGKSNVKINNGRGKTKFENKVNQENVAKKPATENSYEVILEDKRYLVGDKVECLQNHSTNKITQSNKVAIYTAIAKTIKEKENIYLAIGLPNEHYTEKNEADLQQLLAGDIKIEIDGIASEFQIKEENILVLPECYSVDYEDIPRVMLIDFGYRNLNLNILEYGNMLPEFMKHSELGVHTLKQSIAKKLEEEYRDVFEIKDLTDHILLNGLPNDSKSKQLLSKGTIEYLSKVKNEIESKRFNLKTIDKIVLRGGGTHLIKQEEVANIFNINQNNVIVEGGEYKNVEIFYEVAAQYFEGRD